MGTSKEDLKIYITTEFGYNLSRTLEEIRPGYEFSSLSEKTIPEAITAFLESDNYESAIRGAISLGGDADTLACVTGGIAHAFYDIKNIPHEYLNKAIDILINTAPELSDIIVDFHMLIHHKNKLK